MHVSVIIPTLNEAEYLPRLLEAIRDQSYDDYEIIVADAGSEDGTREVASSFGARVVDGGMPGEGRNRGAEAARGDFFFFFDADVIIPPDFMEKAVREIEERKLRIAACRAVPLSDLLLDRVIHKIAYLMIVLTKENNPRIPGYCILMEAELFRTIGGFDEEVLLAEDYDLVTRAARHTQLEVIRSTHIEVSMRRFDKEGRLPYVGKSLRVYFHRTFRGEIRDDRFEYEFGDFDPDSDGGIKEGLVRLERKLNKIDRRLSRLLRSSRPLPKRLRASFDDTARDFYRLFTGFRETEEKPRRDTRR
jgi:glycosyltransferase involved in cell wall biosynthesis